VLPDHQYIERRSGRVVTEYLLADRWINFLYTDIREKAPTLFKAVTSSRASRLLGNLCFDGLKGKNPRKTYELMHAWGIDVSELFAEPQELDSPFKLFTRQIRYWECRPMEKNPRAVASPAEARILLGSFDKDSLIYIKGKFFEFHELLGEVKQRWHKAFADGDFAIFRLTPEKYHYVHAPVSGHVVDFYEIDGAYNSCNPTAVINLAGVFSKNKRVVTIIDTDVAGGTGVGLVAHIEIVALMVGDIKQCYSSSRYHDPQPIAPGMNLVKGQPKSLFHPGSSTVVLVFQPRRVRFACDLLENQRNFRASSRFAHGFGRGLVETDLRVRETVAAAYGHLEE
jgi:phosphatidylserine decarboxylase